MPCGLERFRSCNAKAQSPYRAEERRLRKGAIFDGAIGVRMGSEGGDIRYQRQQLDVQPLELRPHIRSGSGYEEGRWELPTCEYRSSIPHVLSANLHLT